MTVLAKYSQIFADKFTLTSTHKQKLLDKHLSDISNNTERRCYRESMNGIIWDKVKKIIETKPLKGKVYDVTVEKTRNFVTLNGINLNDTFHLAGVAAKSNVTRGVPRLKELLKATHNPKAVSLTIYLRKDLRQSKDEARRIAQELEFTVLQDLTQVARIYFDPRDDDTLIGDDAEWLSFYAGYERAKSDVEQSETKMPPAKPVDATVDATSNVDVLPPAEQQQNLRSPWILRLELDREKMFSKNITMDDIAFVLNQKFDTEVSTVYSDYNATRLVFRLRLNTNDTDPLNSLSQLKMLQNKILMGTIVRGVPGLRSVSFNKTSDQYEIQNGKYVAVDQFVLDTDGSNMLDVMCHPDVDASRVISNNVHNIFENFGIEATRAILFKEISTLFEETYVNYRHLCLLCDVMAARGRLMSVDRYGINKNNIGPLAKASFEQTEDIMLRAALYGELDPITGVSANIMTGQPIRGGTSFSQILLDENALMKYTVEAPEDNRFQPQSGNDPLTEEQLDEVLYAKEGGYCATGNLQLEASLPPIVEGTINENIPEIEIELVDE
jgi:DNA-directed RNA polymerase II subunit RPB1